jgi:hypothetical protein
LAFGLSGTALPTTSGGTGLTSFTANGVVYASSTSALATGSALTFDGNDLKVNVNVSYGGNAFAPNGGGIFFNGFNAFGSGFYSDATGQQIRFQASGSEQMRLTSTGLGIGTSSPSEKLHIYGANPYFLLQGSEASAQTLYIRESAGGLYFGQYGVATRMLLDTSGNLGLGVTPSAWASGWRTLQIGAGANFIGRTGVVNQLQLVANGYYNGTNYIYQNTGEATQYFQTGGYHAWGIAPSGTAGNAITFTQAMTLDASGNLLVGTTSNLASGARLNVNYAFSNDGAAWKSDSTSTHNAIVFKNPNGTVGTIQTSGSNTLYNVTSDQRLKTNIVDAPESNVDAIKVRSFDWVADGSHQVYGVVAQELLEVAPYAVSQPAKSDEMMGVDYSKLVPMLVKEIQSLRKRLATAGI